MYQHNMCTNTLAHVHMYDVTVRGGWLQHVLCWGALCDRFFVLISIYVRTCTRYEYSAGSLRISLTNVVLYKCTYTHIHTYMHTYLHTYIHTYIHAYIHTYTHIHTCVCMCQVMTVVVRELKRHEISEDELRILLGFVDEDIHDYQRQSTAFPLLKVTHGLINVGVYVRGSGCGHFYEIVMQDSQWRPNFFLNLYC